MLRLAFDFIITWRETRTRPNAYQRKMNEFFLNLPKEYQNIRHIFLFEYNLGLHNEQYYYLHYI